MPVHRGETATFPGDRVEESSVFGAALCTDRTAVGDQLMRALDVGTTSRRHATWVAASVGAASGLLVLARLATRARTLDSLWAEDGSVFIRGALTNASGSFFYRYSGYGHVGPRLLAELAWVFPSSRWPMMVALSAAAVTSLVSGCVFGATSRLGLWTPAALAASLMPALLPGLGIEVIGNWANLQCVITYGLAWILLVEPDRASRSTSPAVGFLAAAGGAMSAFVAPLIFFHGRRWYRHPALPGLAIGIVYQLVVQFSPADATNPSDRAPVLTMNLTKNVAKVAAQTLLDSGGGIVRGSAAKWIGVLALAVIMMVIAFGPSRRRSLAVAASGLATVTVLSILNGSAASRYAACGVMLILGGFLLSVGSSERNQQGVVRVISMVALSLVFVMGFRISAVRASGRSFATALESAKQQCRNDGSPTVELPVAPTTPDGPWGIMVLDCARIE